MREAAGENHGVGTLEVRILVPDELSVLAEHGRPVLTLTIRDVEAALGQLRAAIGSSPAA